MITTLEMDAVRAHLARRQDVSQQLMDVLERVEPVFQIQSPHAPALVCVGGLVGVEGNAAAAIGASSFSTTGNGLSLDQALVSCLGEAAEILSQFERPGDIVSLPQDAQPQLASGWVGEILATISRCHDRVLGIDWVFGHDPVMKTAVLVPADLCLRRVPAHRAFPVVSAMSSGAAASANWVGAAERAVLELVERDAAALWWFGARKPAYFRHDDAAGMESCLLLHHLRAGQTNRISVLLDLTTDLGIPVVAACSYDTDGFDLACGVAARLDRVSAARAAILEMAQMELSTHIARLKRQQRGEASLNEADRRHLERATLCVPPCALFETRAPVDTVRGVASVDRSDDARDILEPHTAPQLVFDLAKRQISVVLVDHSRRDIGIPVVRALSAQLQPFSPMVTTERLKDMLAKTGGGARHHGGVLPF